MKRLTERLFNSFKNDAAGSIIVIVAMSLTVIMVLAALVLDLGLAYFKTANIQNTADAASLAAGQLLPVDTTDEEAILAVKNRAILYAEKNGVDNLLAEEVTLQDSIFDKYTSVRVNIPCVVELSFAKVVGINTFAFARSAKASITPSTLIDGVAPLGVEKSQLSNAIATNNTEHIYLKYGPGDGTEGSYGAIDLDGVQGGGANDFSMWMQFGYSGVIEVGDNLLPVEKGNMAGPTETAITQRYLACTHFQDEGGCTADHYDPSCPRLLKILVFEKVGSSYVKVKGFAVFVLEGAGGSNGEVLGSYIKTLDPGNIARVVDWENTEFGVYNLGLSG